MTPTVLRAERVARGWSQKKVARKLGVSQAYVAMLEQGTRPLTKELARKLVSVCAYSPAFLPVPVEVDVRQMYPQQLVENLASLGYPGYAYLKSRAAKKNPGVVLLAALAQNNLEARLAEALPWLLLQYWKIDFDWLVEQAKKLDLQNRLGFAASLARRISERSENKPRTSKLCELESKLDRSRLVREEDFLKPARNDVERQWLLQNRPEEAKHWNLVTDLRPEHLAYDG